MGGRPRGLRDETGPPPANKTRGGTQLGEAGGASADPECPQGSEAGVRTEDERNGGWQAGESDCLHRPRHTEEESRKHFRQQGPGTSVYGEGEGGRRLSVAR